MAPIDPAVARFLARHSKPPRDAVAEDAAPWRDKSPAEKWRAVLALSRSAAWVLRLNPQRERVLAREDSPHPSYFEIMKRLRSRRVS